jgi:predicted nuclease with RNAse H fold
MLIIGLDAATKPERFGYAIAEKSSSIVRVLETGVLKSKRSADALSDTVAARLRGADRALVAIDAPLGWPAAAGSALQGHTAGGPMTIAPDKLFHRVTDEFVRSKTQKRPLEVGANLIARAAHAALSALERLREETGLPLPLVWAPEFTGSGVIEVYPGASLISWGIPQDGYKKDAEIRRRIANRLETRTSGLSQGVVGPVDAFDAALCTVAAADFLDGNAWMPDDIVAARKEGWIWFKRNDE